MKYPAKTVTGWGPDVNEVVPSMSKNGQGSRMKGVGMDVEPTPKKDGYQTNYKGLPGHTKVS